MEKNVEKVCRKLWEDDPNEEKLRENREYFVDKFGITSESRIWDYESLHYFDHKRIFNSVKFGKVFVFSPYNDIDRGGAGPVEIATFKYFLELGIFAEIPPIYHPNARTYVAVFSSRNAMMDLFKFIGRYCKEKNSWSNTERTAARYLNR